MSTLPAAAQDQLRQLVEQIERLEQDKKAITDNITDKYLEAKAVGFDVKAIRTIVRMRKKSKTEREEEESILEVYLHALGMLIGTPMGEYLQDTPKSPAEQILAKMSPSEIDEAATRVKLGESAVVAIAKAIDKRDQHDGVTTTVSVNGGPQIPLEDAIPAVTKMVERSFGRGTRKDTVSESVP